MTTQNFLFRRRNGVYYFRARVPAMLAKVIGRVEFKHSLRTRNLQVAIRRLKPYLALYTQIKTMTDIEKILQQLKSAGIEPDNLAHKFGRLKIGDLEIENVEIDSEKPGDVEAAISFIKASVESHQRPSQSNYSQSNIDGLAPVRLESLVDIYFNEKTVGSRWTDRTQKEYRQYFNQLLDMVGWDVVITDINKITAQKVKNLLVKLPTNFKKLKKYQGKSIEEIAEMGDEPRNVATINKILSAYSSFFSYLVSNHYADVNFFEGLSISVSKNVRDLRRGYTEEEMQKLFDYLRTRNPKHSYYYWLPRILLLSGLRLEEASQLYLSDIYEKDGVWVFDINDDLDKSVKNPNAIRKIPIHSELVRLGLVDRAIELTRKGQIRLFPELKKINGRFSHSASNWFNRERTKLGWTNLKPKLDFHSFRSNLASKLQSLDVPEIRTAAILGHVQGNTESYRRYSSGTLLEQMTADIERIKYNVDYD